MGEVFNGIPPELMIRLKDKYKLSTFVETGTSTGNTTNLAAKYFDKVFTCEIDKEVYDGNKFSGLVFSYNLPSDKFLELISYNKLDDVLFFLDAHWCGTQYKKIGKECVVMEELKIIFDKWVGKNIAIVIDDARFFIGKPSVQHDASEWPTIEELAKVINNAGYIYHFDCDCIVVWKD